MTASTETRTMPKEIKAVPLKHPGRWICAALVIVLVAIFVVSSARNEAFHWDTYFKYLLDTRIATAAVNTIILTIVSMLLGVVLGVIVAVLRMSPNPVFRGVAWVYLWLFRGTPVYVQLMLWGLVGSIYQVLNVGVAEFDLQEMLSNTFILAIIGLGLNEASYMAEIVRAGIQAVPEGQFEASKALGMTWWQNMRRTVLPQAMRIIIPPTGNEFISLLKTTSLVIVIPYTQEIFGRANDISNSLFQPVPLMLVAATWYLAITSLLMAGQYYLERYYARGSSRSLTSRQLAALADAEGVPPRNVTVEDSPQTTQNRTK